MGLLSLLKKRSIRQSALLGAVFIASIGIVVASSPAEASATMLRASDVSVAVGGTVDVPIALSEATSGLSGFDLVVSLSNPGVAKLVDVSFPAFGLTSFTIVSDSEVHLKAVDLMHIVEPGAVDITLAAVVLEGLKKGKSEIHVQIVRLDDEDGFAIPAELVAGSLSMQKGAVSPGSGKKSGNKGWGKGGRKS